MTRLGVVVTVLLAIVAAAVLHADEPASKSKSKPSELDKQLLEGLGGELLEGLDLPPTSPKAAEPRDSNQPDKSARDPEPPTIVDGEDVDLAGSAANPIIDLGRRMKSVERLIGEKNTSAATQRMQQEIVADLTHLIDRIRQQKKQQKNGGSRRPRSRPGSPPGEEPGDQESRDPAEDSESRVRQSDAGNVETRDLENLLKEVWGHLPERVRQQMLSGSAEEVLPKYQKLIEEYYKRLAEDAAKNP